MKIRPGQRPRDLIAIHEKQRKRRYTREQAELALVHIEKKVATHPSLAGMSAYRCEICGFWHLGHEKAKIPPMNASTIAGLAELIRDYISTYGTDLERGVTDKATYRVATLLLRPEAFANTHAIVAAIGGQRPSREDYRAVLAAMNPELAQLPTVDSDYSFVWDACGPAVPLHHRKPRTRSVSGATPEGAPLVWIEGREDPVSPSVAELETVDE